VCSPASSRCTLPVRMHRSGLRKTFTFFYRHGLPFPWIAAEFCFLLLFAVRIVSLFSGHLVRPPCSLASVLPVLMSFLRLRKSLTTRDSHSLRSARAREFYPVVVRIGRRIFLSGRQFRGELFLIKVLISLCHLSILNPSPWLHYDARTCGQVLYHDPPSRTYAQLEQCLFHERTLQDK
jgi:hypothetical protein